jgi:hypothetical protein
MNPQEKPAFDPYWDEKKVAAFLGVSVKFLQVDRANSRRIPFAKIGRAVRYDPRDVQAYVEACKQRRAAGAP